MIPVPPLPDQAPSGAFLSEVTLSDGRGQDENGFVTALCCEALWPWRHDPGIGAALERALTYLERCADPDQPLLYRFYPKAGHPDWIGVTLPPDADDTALIATVLHRYGRLSVAELRNIYHHALCQARIGFVSERSTYWHDPGGFETWICPHVIDNKIDLTVNVNVLVLLEKICQPTPESNSIRGMLAKALDWMGESKARAAQVTPWYPEPIELLYALERAARFGVQDLEPHIVTLRRLDWVRRDLASNDIRAVCGSDDGRFKWYCDGLDRLRSTVCI